MKLQNICAYIYPSAGETAHSLLRSLRLSRYGQIGAQSVFEVVGKITIINQFAKKNTFRKQFKCHFTLVKQLNCISMQTS